MKKTLGTKNFSFSIKTTNDKDLKNRLTALIENFTNKSRGALEARDCLPCIEYLLYCAYVSSNADYFEIKDFDDRYRTDEVVYEIGNSYLAKEYLEYFEKVDSKVRPFPVFKSSLISQWADISFIKRWIESFDNSCLALKEKSGFPVAHTIYEVLADSKVPTYDGRSGSEFYSSPSLAEMICALGDVEGRSVFDFACGAGTVLSGSLYQGAASVSGRDIDPLIVEQAKLLCFFANPDSFTKIAVEDMFEFKSTERNTFDRVLVQPPLGVKIWNQRGGREVDAASNLGALSGDLFGDSSVIPTTAEEFSIMKALYVLKPGGTAIVQVAMGALFRMSRNEQAFRESLVKNGYIQAVFELPGGMQYGTAIEVALIVLRKPVEREKEAKFLLVDMKRLASKEKGLFEKGAHASKTVISKNGISWAEDLLHNPREIPMVSVLVGEEEFYNNGFSLVYSRYGEVYDFKAAWESARSLEEILSDSLLLQDEVIEITQDINVILADIASVEEEVK